MSVLEKEQDNRKDVLRVTIRDGPSLCHTQAKVILHICQKLNVVCTVYVGIIAMGDKSQSR